MTCLTWILTHERPDGDAIGSSCGLWYALDAAGIHAHIVVCGDYPLWWPVPIPTPSIKRDPPLDGIDPTRDRLILLDAGTLARCGAWTTIIGRAPDIVVDHHPPISSRDNTTTTGSLLHIVDPTAVSTCDLVVRYRDRIISALGGTPAPMSDAERLWWYLGTWTDTLGLTKISDPTVLGRIESLYVPTKTQELVSHLQHRFSFAAIELWRDVRIIPMESWVFVGVSAATYRKYGLNANSAKDIILHWWGATFDFLGIIVAVERATDHAAYLSIRSRHRPPRAHTVAKRLGGGGHDAAAGAVITPDMLGDTDLLDWIQSAIQG